MWIWWWKRNLYNSFISISNDCEVNRKLSADKAKKAQESEESVAIILVEATKISDGIKALFQSMKSSRAGSLKTFYHCIILHNAGHFCLRGVLDINVELESEYDFYSRLKT